VFDGERSRAKRGQRETVGQVGQLEGECQLAVGVDRAQKKNPVTSAMMLAGPLALKILIALVASTDNEVIT
jgi:hypothetical protein